MRLDIAVDRQSRVPLHLQVAEEIRTAIFRGHLEAGSRLPTVRALAATAGVANQTIASAYQLLREWGTVEATVGRGTFVASDLPRKAASSRLAAIVEAGPLAEFESISDAAGLRSLATAVPDPWLFHSDELIAEIQTLRNESPWTFYYAPPEGSLPLRQALAARLQSQGIAFSPREVLVTYGATHGLSLIVDELCQRGDRVLMEAPGFLGGESFFVSRGLAVERVRSGPEGMDLDHLEKLCETPVKLLLCWPSFGPATGSLMPLNSRLRLLGIARERRFTIVEDAHYAPLSYRERVPSLAALSSGGEVVEVDSLSGYLSAGLRTGWVVGTSSLIPRLAARVHHSGTAGVAFLQTALAAYLSEGRLDDHLRRVVPQYRARRDALMSALSLHMPRGTAWTVPLGGLASWVTLGGLDTESLYADTLERGVAFAPGTMFDPAAATSLRLSFGTQEPEAIREAVATLGRLVEARSS